MEKKTREELEEEYRRQRYLNVKKFIRLSGLKEYASPELIEKIGKREVKNFTFDKRKMGERTVLFYASNLPHSRLYDEEYLAEALKEKPLLVVSDVPTGYRYEILCDSRTVEAAFLRISRHIRSLHKAKVIAVTGSVGKTSMKEMIEAVLRSHYRKPLVSRGNNNSVFSVTRNILNLERTTNVYLQEVGAKAPGIVEFSAKQLNANICVYTNIGDSHMENYGSREALIQDKLSLSVYGRPKGVNIIKYEDEALRNFPYPEGQRIITYSAESEEADYHASDIVKGSESIDFTLCCPQGRKYPVHINAVGEHNILNATAAFAVGELLKLEPEEIISGLAGYQPSGLRHRILNVGGYRIFADCYNSSLISVGNSLKTLDSMKTVPGGRKIAVLGDICELGDMSEATHRAVGKLITEHDVDVFLAYGKDIRMAAEEAKTIRGGVFMKRLKGHKVKPEIKYFDDRDKLNREIAKLQSKDDIILFKASHAVNIGTSMDKLYGTDINESTAIGQKEFEIVTEGDFEMYIFETSASVKRYIGTSETVHVPETVKAVVKDHLFETETMRSLPVEKIGKTAFRGNRTVKEVYLPDTVVRIRDGAFKGSNIEKIHFGKGLLTVGKDAFTDCENLKNLTYPDTVRSVDE